MAHFLIALQYKYTTGYRINKYVRFCCKSYIIYKSIIRERKKKNEKESCNVFTAGYYFINDMSESNCKWLGGGKRC